MRKIRRESFRVAARRVAKLDARKQAVPPKKIDWNDTARLQRILKGTD